MWCSRREAGRVTHDVGQSELVINTAQESVTVLHQVDENPSYGGPDCVKLMLVPVDVYDIVSDVSDASVFSVGAIVIGLRVGAIEGSKFGIPVGDFVRCTTGPLLGSADGASLG